MRIEHESSLKCKHKKYKYENLLQVLALRRVSTLRSIRGQPKRGIDKADNFSFGAGKQKVSPRHYGMNRVGGHISR